MDIADIAEQNEQREREEALRAQALRAGASAPSPDGNCADCGEPIDPQRLAVCPTAGRCVECQNDHDRNRTR